VRRHPANPILTRADVPDVPPLVVDPSSVFNPGATSLGGRIHLLLRVQTRGRETVLMPATSDDGVAFEIQPRVVTIEGMGEVGETIHHVYDPRLTAIGDEVYAVLAVDTDRGCRLAVARATARDLAAFELVSFDASGDTRNGVLFPAKVGGRYVRLERPNRKANFLSPADGDEMIFAASDDLVSWQPVGPVMRGRPRSWDERIGSGPPPVRVADGWLHVYHGVATHFASGGGIYQAGAVLLDADDPTRVIARTRRNVLEPREPYETVGQVPNVVFPSGMVVEGVEGDAVAPPEARVLLYYGAADTSVALATCAIRDLLAACREDA
jgi:beta-1,4-mannooligosaccharide/beta-1,4-mannosyl-N-acetylglucosamine phosphorylase